MTESVTWWWTLLTACCTQYWFLLTWEEKTEPSLSTSPSVLWRKEREKCSRSRLPERHSCWTVSMAIAVSFCVLFNPCVLEKIPVTCLRLFSSWLSNTVPDNVTHSAFNLCIETLKIKSSSYKRFNHGLMISVGLWTLCSINLHNNKGKLIFLNLLGNWYLCVLWGQVC